jgi:hypothetical protein
LCATRPAGSSGGPRGVAANARGTGGVDPPLAQDEAFLRGVEELS